MVERVTERMGQSDGREAYDRNARKQPIVDHRISQVLIDIITYMNTPSLISTILYRTYLDKSQSSLTNGEKKENRFHLSILNLHIDEIVDHGYLISHS